jgi:hypothetical protein
MSSAWRTVPISSACGFTDATASRKGVARSTFARSAGAVASSRSLSP